MVKGSLYPKGRNHIEIWSHKQKKKQQKGKGNIVCTLLMISCLYTTIHTYTHTHTHTQIYIYIYIYIYICLVNIARGPRTYKLPKAQTRWTFSSGYEDQWRKLEANWKPQKYGLVFLLHEHLCIPLESCNWVENVVLSMLRTLGACFHERKKRCHFVWWVVTVCGLKFVTTCVPPIWYICLTNKATRWWMWASVAGTK